MRHKQVVTGELERLLAVQSGVASLAQVEGMGGSRSMVRRLRREGHWSSVAPGIHVVGGEPTWQGWVWAGLLLCAPTAVVAGRAAGHLSGLWPQPAEPIEIWTGGGRVRVQGPWRFLEGTRPGRGEPPRVDAATAVIEACGDVDAEEACSLVFQALRSRRVGVPALRRQLHSRTTARHRRLLLDVLDSAAAGAESVLEDRYLRRVERAHGLPTGQRQARVSVGTRSDVVLGSFGVLIELDGRVGHEGEGVFRDAARDNAHAAAGWVTLRFGWRDVAGDPCGVARMVAEVLRARGWSGDLRRCRAC